MVYELDDVRAECRYRVVDEIVVRTVAAAQIHNDHLVAVFD